ncbi:MAG: hypothetical protein H0U03_12820 [Actinobacteria bacterium]|nr:hypothetical protein [Actinomycetota bacterium]
MTESMPHATVETAYRDVYTVIHDLGDSRDIAWIHGAIWPPVGTVIELVRPERHALVVGIRLVLVPNDRAIVRVDVQDPGEGELIARDAATRLTEAVAVPDAVEVLAVESAAFGSPPEQLAFRAGSGSAHYPC